MQIVNRVTTRGAIQQFLMLLLYGIAAVAVAQPSYPTRSIRIVVANTQGSTVDLVARQLGEQLAAQLGQAVVVINQPGAAGLVGAQTLARSARDGYTLGFYGNTAVIAPHLQKVNYDPMQDISTLAIVGNIPFAAVVPKTSRFRSLAQVMAAARSNPGGLKLGSAGSGTAIHLAAVQWQAIAAIDLLHVPYKGVAPMQTALLGGDEIDIAFPTVGSVAALVKDGRLNALAMTGSQRSAVMPDVPTMQEIGLTKFVFESWLALVAPSGLEPDVSEKLQRAVSSAVGTDAIKKLFADNSITPALNTGADAQLVVQRDFEAMGLLLKKSGLLTQ